MFCQTPTSKVKYELWCLCWVFWNLFDLHPCLLSPFSSLPFKFWQIATTNFFLGAPPQPTVSLLNGVKWDMYGGAACSSLSLCILLSMYKSLLEECYGDGLHFIFKYHLRKFSFFFFLFFQQFYFHKCPYAKWFG